jgi:type II secretory pathway pseudopilin PulG
MVELMVVIVIIGILAAGALLSMSSGEDHAQATAILSDLRIMKSGAHVFVFDSGDFVPVAGTNYAELLGQYMDHGRIINNPVRYAFFVDIYNDKWWVGVRLTGTARVHDILESKAVSSGTMPLYGSTDVNTPPPDYSTASIYKKTDSVVWTKAK